MQCYERRTKRLRPKEGWHKTTAYPYRCHWPRALWREMHGHHLLVTPCPDSKRVFEMWMDGYYRGRRNTKRVAKLSLVRMACDEVEVVEMSGELEMA